MRFIIPILLLLTFCQPALAETSHSDNDIKLDIGTAQAVFKELEGNDNYIDNLTEQSLTKLPVGEKRTLNNVSYTVGITQVKFYPQYAEFTAFLRIRIPQGAEGSTKDLFFGAHGIKLSFKGGIIGDVKLGLLGDFPIDLGGNKVILTLKGAFDKNNNMVNGGDPVTYASIDCNGFKELSVSADVAFSRDILVPDSAGFQGAGQVHASFSTIASDWNDILVNLALPAFQVKGLNDFSFEVARAVFDFSDLRNDAQAVFPQKYTEQYLLPGNPQLWRGVYISNLKITLPKLFTTGDTTKRITLEGKNLLIDNQGFTGLVSATNLVTLDQGTAGSWPISIDKFTLDIMAGKIQGAGFGGSIKLPVDDKTELVYDALISPDNEYLLTVKPKDTINFAFLRASKVSLYPNSSVTLEVKNGKFLPKAILNGKMTINATTKKDAPAEDSGLAKMPAIEFRGLQLQTVSPKIQIESMGYDGEIKFGNFPASINSIAVTASNDEARLSFGISVQLMGDGLRGDAGLTLIGKLSKNKGLESWSYDKLKLDSLGVNFNKGGVIIDGHIYIFEDDPTYGKGFAGDVSLTLEKMQLSVHAKALFGKMSNPDYRYWYADAYADLGAAGIPIFAGLKINGLGGGAYEHMKLAGKVEKGASGIGVTPTGFLYVPDAKTSFGLKAIVGFASQDGKAVNGHLTLEMAFAAGGGLRYIHFDGMAKFAKGLPVDQFAQLGDKLDRLQVSNEEGKQQYAADRKKSSADAAITAAAALDLDFENSSIHGVFEVYLNAGPMTGLGPDGLAGQCVMHYDPHTWYIYMGKPDNRMGVKFGIGPINLQVGSYMMVGNDIPASPPPPKIIADILGVDAQQLDYMRDLNALGNGKGFAFGADMSLSTGDLSFLIFYAKFTAGLGFDMMLKDYGNAQCKGSDGPIGINGWYANGQAYAYFQGDIGLTVKLFMKTKKINILKIGAAVLLQAKLPNPAWFRGYVGGYYSVLGGLVSGKCSFKVTMGQECELVNGNPLGGIQVISDLTPAEGANGVDVFAAPQAAFNMSVGKEMEMEDDNGNYTKYRVVLDKFELSSKGSVLPGKLQWNSDRNSVAMYSTEVLPPQLPVKAVVVVSFEEYKGGAWRTVMTDGARTVETKEVTFVTGEAPESIPLSNIQYEYPVIGQEHLYTKEYPNGYIQLKRGQAYLFDKNNGWKQMLRVKDASGTTLTPDWNYDTNNKRLTWSLSSLGNLAKYNLGIVSLPPAASGSQQVTQNTAVTNDEDGGTTAINTNTISGTLTNSTADEKVILTYAFSTSGYNTFAEKIDASTITKVFREPIFLPDVHALQANTVPTEAFDVQELSGSSYTEGIPMIRPVAVMDGDEYFRQDIQPLIYNRYPYKGWVKLPRDSGQSLIPDWAIYPVEVYLLYPDKARLPFRYHLPKQYKTDLVSIQTQLAAKSIYTPLPDDYQRLMNTMFPLIRQGNYKMKLIYVLPGGITGTNTVVDMYNPIL
jgi:hypothetical protein